MESSVAAPDEGLLNVTDLVRMFETSEESSYEARKMSERDRDYHDNIQLTADEKKVLRRRGQPEYIDNRIKTKVDYLVGLEKQQRINPRALPRTPMHEDDADSATEALNYVADKEQFDYKRSAIWRNLLIEGAGGMSVSVEPGYNGEWSIRLRRIPWDRMFWDPHSSEVDYSDAGYLGTVTWMDVEDARKLYQGQEAADILDDTIKDWSLSDTYDDKPKWNVWADKKRKRVRIVAIWLKRGDEWYFAEFTKGGILKAGPSPYKDDEGRSDCELIFQSAYVDRENNRFGLVREMISLQDGVNKRSSKSLHALNTAQVVTNELAIAGQDPEKLRREAAKPDGFIVLSGDTDPNSFKFETRMDMAQGQVMLLQEAKQSIDLKGPNATQMGEKTAMGSSSASGKAILASQQGGMISLGDLLDNLRHLDKRVFRAIWNRIRQYWTSEKWLRVTDDEDNVKWVGINVDPFMAQQQMARNPAMAQRISGIVGNVAQLDCDIIIDESPMSPQAEQSDALVRLREVGVQIPDIALVRAMPNFHGKANLVKAMEQQAEKPDPMQQLQVRGAAAEVQETEASAQLKQAQAAKAVADAQNVGAGQQPEDPRPKMMESAVRLQEGQIKLANTEAKGRADQAKAALDIEGKSLDNIGRRLDIQRQRETPIPQPSQAA